MENNRETLKAIALDIVNKAYRAFDKEPLVGFKPGVVTEDTDCVIQALEDATGLSLDWGEFDGTTHWLGVWKNTPEIEEGCVKLAQAWDTSYRPDSGDFYVELPELLAEFATRVAVEFEYPELVKE
ncbi:MAG TPA: hypothetical protein VLR90_19410 [Blastocatellia bacterium]|nr:hypothetical protein [Blastocatellia bacterium]